jgi:hypothetical protein
MVTESLREIARRGAREAERQALAEVLERVRWNRAEASRILKVSYKTLLHKIAECELVSPSRRVVQDFQSVPHNPSRYLTSSPRVPKVATS